MPRIEIIEKDETSAGVYAEATDVVYIPGFVDVTQECLFDDDGNYVGIEANKPTLFTTVKQFESLCGKRAAVFDKAQLYSDLQSTTATGFTGFSNAATPYHRVMFQAGQEDPSYIMAKEYLNAGLNVLYERVNNSTEFEKLLVAPGDWERNYNTYYTKTDKYCIMDNFATPPLWYSKVKEGKQLDHSGKTKYVTAKWDGIEGTHTDYNITSFDNLTVKDGDTAGVDTYVIENEFFTRSGVEVDVTNALWEEDKFFIKENDEYIPVTLTQWTDTQNGFKTNNTIYTVEYVSVTTNNSTTLSLTQLEKTIDDSWSNVYYKHYTKETDAYDNIKLRETTGDTKVEFNSFAEVYTLTNGINIKNMYKALEGVFNVGDIDGLADKGNYSIKYLTSGGYPVYEYNNNAIVDKMITLAVQRGDCVAFIDHTDHSDRDDNIDHKTSVYYTVSNDQTFKNNGEFATMFTPWASYNRTTTDRDDEGSIIVSSSVRMPGSYAYFIALGDSIRTNANWLAIAGSARGVVLNLASNGMTTNIPNGAADKMQPRDGVAVNAITNIKPYGYTIWGNRTLKNNGEKGNLTATSFLNVRNLISDVKKVAYKVARQLTFEQNNDILWVNFKALIAPTLDRMLSGYGISGYKIVRDTEHEKAAEKATVCAKIILYPVYPVEDFYITIVLKDDEISVE